MLIKNLKLYKLQENWNIDAEKLHELLFEHAFVESNFIDSSLVNVGWSPVMAGYDLEHELVFGIKNYLCIRFKQERKLLPTSVINHFTSERVADIEADQGFKLSRKKIKMIKEDLTQVLKSKAFSVFKDIYVVFDLANHNLWICTSSNSLADDVITLLAKSIEPLPILHFSTATPPVTAMTSWVVDGSPSPFTVDQDTELKGITDSRETIKYAYHTPDPNEVQKHLNNGKICTKLSLTWNNKIQFMLNDSLDIRKITPIDLESVETSDDDVLDAFKADLTLICSEISELILDLTDALGGAETKR